MSADTKPVTWCAKPTAGHDLHGQSAVYDESTGKDIAIVYDGVAHAQLIAAAPEMLEELRDAVETEEAWLADYGQHLSTAAQAGLRAKIVRRHSLIAEATEVK